MSLQHRWCLLPVSGAAVLALTALPLWPGFAPPVRASDWGRAPHAVSLAGPRSAPSRPASALGQVELKAFGRTAAIIGDMVAVDPPSNQEVDVYARSGITFKLAATLKPSNPNGSGFGAYISTSGTEMIVGGPGAAYIFTQTAQGWKQVAGLHRAGNESTEFGATVDISGSYAIVSDINGHAYIYHVSGSQWVQSADLSLPISAETPLFGDVVGIDGTTAFVNADKADEGGSVFIYTLNGPKWTKLAQVRGSDVTNGVEEVQSLDVSGNTLAVGVPGIYDQAGRVYIFTDQSGTWKQTAELKGTDTRASDQFGFHVSLSGSTLAVGAPDRSNGGAVYVFTQSGGTWTQTHEYEGADERPNDQLGTTTAVSSSLVVGGAPEHGSGAVYIFAPGIGATPPAVPLRVFFRAVVPRKGPQLVNIITLPKVHVDLQVTYPGGGGVKSTGTTDGSGEWRHAWIVRAKNKGTATISITVTSGTKRRHFTKHFQIL